MEWFIGFLGAVIGTAAGGLSVFLTTRAQMRRELEHTYDQDLRARRVDAYKGLYKLTGKMPRYWPHNPVRSEMHEWPDAFDDWYFAKAGGLFLSDDARKAYNVALETMAAVSNEGPDDDALTSEQINRMWRAGQALRRVLAADIGAAERPQLPGQQPYQTPAAQQRFPEKDPQEKREHPFPGTDQADAV